MNETSADLTIEKVREYVTEVREGLITGEFYIDAAAYIRDCEFLLAQIEGFREHIDRLHKFHAERIERYEERITKLENHLEHRLEIIDIADAENIKLKERIAELNAALAWEGECSLKLKERIASIEAASRMRGAASGEY